LDIILYLKNWNGSSHSLKIYMMKKFFYLPLVLLLTMGLTVSCNNDDDDDENTEPQLDNIVELVIASDDLTQLEAAVIKADLVTTLEGNGPFTVFAPTDAAFVDLLNVLGPDFNSLDDFDEQAEIDLLRNILLYHVVSGEVTSGDLQAGMVPTSLPNNSIEVIDNNGTFVIGDASDTDANLGAVDIMASNGVVHIIDKVLLPQEAVDFVAGN
jgi:uncharacterized surface protein with fasciclin (FAS1) repeats